MQGKKIESARKLKSSNVRGYKDESGKPLTPSQTLSMRLLYGKAVEDVKQFWRKKKNWKCTFKKWTDTEMKTLKRILKLLLLLVILAVVGYFVYTGFRI